MNEHAAHRAHLKTTAATVWLIGSAAVAATVLDGPARLIGILALLGAAVAGQTLQSGRWAAAAGLGASAVAILALWRADTDIATTGLIALEIVISCGVGRWSRAPVAAARPTPEARHHTTTAAEARLPAGVADERLLDRLAVHEMTRARRYEHPLTLLLVDIDGWAVLSAEQGKRGAFERLSQLAIRVRRLLRDVDAIGLHGDGQLAILLPETPLDGALVVAARIEEAARQDVGCRVRVGAAVFPEDAVTVDGLLHEAEAALEVARLEGVAVAQRVQLI